MSDTLALHQMTPVNDGGTSSALAVAVADLTAALATLAKVAAIVADLPDHDSRPSTHWADCHKHHSDCLVLAIRAALDTP